MEQTTNTMFLWGTDYLAQHREPLQWIVQDLIPVGGKANLFGRPKAGKSFLALQMAAAISSGEKDFLGFAIQKNGPVVYIQIDTAGSIWFQRVKDMTALGFEFSNVAFADTDTGIPFPLNIHANAAELKAKLQEIKPVLVIWDTVRELHPGDENDSSVMKNVVSAMMECCSGPLNAKGVPEWRAAILIVSHRKKENANYEDDLMNANRGSSYMAGAVDSVIQLSKNSIEYQGRTCGLTKRTIIWEEHPEVGDVGIFKVDEEEAKIITTWMTVMNEMPTASNRAQGTVVAERCGITQAAALGHYKRKKAQLAPKLTPKR